MPKELSPGAAYSPLGDSSHHGGSKSPSPGEAVTTLSRGAGDAQPTLIAGRVKFIDALGIVCGIIIGSGIFSSPGVALSRAGSPGLCLIAWAVSGILVIFTATCYMELAGMMPSAGGDFVYLKRAYGDRASFAFAWFNFWISKTGSQAIIATVFGRYVENILIILTNGNNAAINAASVIPSSGDDDYNKNDGESIISKCAAVALIILLTIINCLSVKESTLLQNVLTAAKLGLVLLLFVAAAVYTTHSNEVTQNSLSPMHSFEGSNGIVGFSTALVACLWSFDGWADLNFMTEELEHPNQLPRIVTVSVLVVTISYLLCNVAYLLVMPVQDIKDSRAIGSDFGIAINDGNLYGFWPLMIAFGVALSTLGSQHGSIMTGGRAFFAVGRDGKAPKCMGYVNRLGSPYGALIAQGVWGVILLILPGSNFNSLLDYCVPVSWAFYALAAFSVVIMRKKEPNLPRPFKVPLYPLPPVLVVILALCIGTSSLVQNPFYCLLALGFVSLSFPCHWYFFEGQNNYQKKGDSDDAADFNGGVVAAGDMDDNFTNRNNPLRQA